MDYQTAKDNKVAASQAFLNAKDDFEAAKGALQDANAEAETKYENLTQKMAEQAAGDTTQEEVDTAKQTYQDAKAAVEDAKIDVDVKAKGVKVFERKKDEAMQQFKEVAFTHFKDQAQPLAQSMIDALNNLQSINEDVKAFREEVKDAGLSATKFMVSNFKKIQLPVKHLKYGYTLQKWEDEMNKKLENLKNQ